MGGSLVLDVVIQPFKKPGTQGPLIPISGGRRGLELDSIFCDRATILREPHQPVSRLISPCRSVKQLDHLLTEVFKITTKGCSCIPVPHSRALPVSKVRTYATLESSVT